MKNNQIRSLQRNANSAIHNKENQAMNSYDQTVNHSLHFQAKFHRPETSPASQLFRKAKKQVEHAAVQISRGQSMGKSVSFIGQDRGKRGMGLKKSILKKSRSESCSSLKSNMSLSNSIMAVKEQSMEYQLGNKVILDKFNAISERLTAHNAKYTDQIYPPLPSSIYLNNSLMQSFCSMFQKGEYSVEWMRLGQLFRGQEIKVWTEVRSQKNIVNNGYMFKNGGFLATAFNAIREQNIILSKMFGRQQQNASGIYCVKIFQTQLNIWKNIIIDDYIPVIINKQLPPHQRYHPSNVRTAFLKVQSPNNVLEIWPFLLQKAYAKYYSTFDSLANGQTLDFLQEIIGQSLQSLEINDNNMQKIQNCLMGQDVISLIEDQNGTLFPLSNKPIHNNLLQYLDTNHHFSAVQFGKPNFKSQFRRLHFTSLLQYDYSHKYLIQLEKDSLKIDQNGMILRNFTLEEKGRCQIMVKQKEQRFFRALLSYEYSWMRLILVQVERNGYRWISCAYGDKKSVKIGCFLEAGNYALIILPEWKTKPYDLTLTYKGTAQTVIEKKPCALYKGILEQSCMDLAQRKGRFFQINKNICSYRLVEKTLGLIIQNINNQNNSSSVKIVRSVEGLKKFNIRPLNQEFKEKETIQVTIQKSSHFTVVLATRGGVQDGLLEMFNFE